MEKKWLAVIGACLLVCIFAAAVCADAPIKLFINGRETKPDVPPQLISGRTMVPIRWVAEVLGANVKWDEDKRSVTINHSPDIWSGSVGLTEGEWISIRNRITRFIMAFDERDETGKELVSSNFDTNLLGPEVVIPNGGLYPAIVDYEFIDAKKEEDDIVRVRVKIYKKYGNSLLTCQNWDFIIDTRSAYIIKGLFVDEKQPLDSHTVFPGLDIFSNQ